MQTRGGQLAGRCKVGRRPGARGLENLTVGATILIESLRSRILTEISQRAICSTPSLVSDEKIRFVNTQVIGSRSHSLRSKELAKAPGKLQLLCLLHHMWSLRSCK